MPLCNHPGEQEPGVCKEQVQQQANSAEVEAQGSGVDGVRTGADGSGARGAAARGRRFVCQGQGEPSTHHRRPVTLKPKAQSLNPKP